MEIMAWKRILESQANVDSPIFIAYMNDEVPLDMPSGVKLVVQTMHPSKKYTMYFDDEEIEDFFFFMEQVYKETA